MIKDRIKLARRKAGLSLRDLSEAMEGKVTAQAIGKYERGESIPSSGVLLALSKALGVSLPYLLDTQGIELAGVEFRQHASTTARQRAEVETQVLESLERYLQIEQALDLPSAEWQPPAPPQALTRIADAEALAEKVREEWSLGDDPIPDMTALLEEKGIKVLILPLPERVSGLTCLVQRPNGQPQLPVIVVNRNLSLERRRLTLGHELAHRLIAPECLSDRDEEKAAHRFAGALLMPRKHLHNEAGKRRHALGFQELIDLKRLYRASGVALLVRLEQIGVIDAPVLTYAFQTVARTWRTREPHELEAPDHRGTMEPALRFERLCYRALSEGFVSLSKASELLRQPVAKVEEGLRGPQEMNAPHR